MIGARLAMLGPALFVLACTQQEHSDPADNDGGAARAPAQPMKPGLYAIGSADRVYSRIRLSADGTFSDLDDGLREIGTGTWREGGPATICFDPEGDGESQQERCWLNGPPDEDGGFLSRRVNGIEHYRVMPMDE